MTLFVAVAIYTAGFADLNWEFRVVFLGVALCGLYATYRIDQMHTPGEDEE